MAINDFNVNITSDQPHEMLRFYKDVVGLEQNLEMGEEAFKVGDNTVLFVDGHSEVHGKAREPQRYLINFWVDDIEAEQKRLEDQGVEFIRNQGRQHWGGVISTFLDPDGNYCQLIEFRPE